jgi:hypothetical protein
MKTAIVAVVTGLLLTGCASPVPLPDVSARKKPALASAKVKPTHYHPVLTGYEHRDPAAPEPWVPDDGSEPSSEEEQQQ